MRRPPDWLPWLGPIVAGLTAGMVVNVWPMAGFVQIVLAAVVAGLVPTIGHFVWKRAWERRD